MVKKATAWYAVDKKLGKFMKLKYSDGSCIYISNKGMIITVPKKKFKKEWAKKNKNFGIHYTMDELDILMQSLGKAEKKWKDFEKKHKGD